MTDDVVDDRRERFLRHIAGAEARGEALAACLPAQGRILEVGCGTGGLLVGGGAGRAGRSRGWTSRRGGWSSRGDG